MLELLTSGFAVILEPSAFIMIIFATIVGIIFGALPGVGSAMAVVLMVPFTYKMGPVVSIAFLTAVYCSAITGGGITAILFKIPGTPGNTPTTFDGYPMAQQGRADKALGIALVCSAIGGIVSAFAMLLISPQLSSAALRFGPAELFAVAFFGLSVLSSLDSNNVLKTLISGLIGLSLATVGMDPIFGVPRFTWGHSALVGGIPMIPVMIGMFAVTEVLKQTVNPFKIEGEFLNKKVSTKLLTIKETIAMKITILRSAVMGTVIGILPGAGATIAGFLSYAAEVKSSKTPERFGKGAPEGVAATETANNAATGGSMVPLLSLGIPGGNSSAIMVSALMLQGVQVGPMLIKTQPVFLSGVFASMIVTNILMVIVAIGIAKVFSKILNMPYSVLGPVIILLSVVGSFALQNNTGDVRLMMVAAILGYAFIKLGFSSAALVLGLVLGDICESNLRRAVMIADGDILSVLSRPITATLLITCAILLILPFARQLYKSKKALS